MISTPSTFKAQSAERTGKAVRQPGRVAFVGAGPGDPGLLTLRAAEYLAEADVVVIDQVSREDFVARYARPDVEIIDAGHGEQGQPLTHASRAKLLVKAAKAAGAVNGNGLVVRLMDGDPAMFNGLSEEALACRKAGISFEVVPGVSAVSAVPSYAGVPLTSAASPSLHVISGGATKVDWTCSTADNVTVVVLGTPEALSKALGDLLAAGRDAATPVALTERGTTITQRTHTTTLGEVVALITSAKVEFPSLAVVGSTVQMREQLSWFETKPLFGWNVLVPRTRDQAGSMITRLSSYGATSDVVPTISVEPPRTPQQMERAIKGRAPGRYECDEFDTVTAVRPVRESFHDVAHDSRTSARSRPAVRAAWVAGGSSAMQTTARMP